MRACEVCKREMALVKEIVFVRTNSGNDAPSGISLIEVFGSFCNSSALFALYDGNRLA